jgi:hypothetical protein
VQLARSFFLALKAQSLLQYLALSLLQDAQSIYSHYQHLAYLQLFDHIDPTYRPLLTSPMHLFIHTKVGLSMGKPTGRHPFPVTLTQKPKKDPKWAEIP